FTVTGDEVVCRLHAHFLCHRIVVRVQEGNGIGGPGGLIPPARAEIRPGEVLRPSPPENGSSPQKKSQTAEKLSVLSQRSPHTNFCVPGSCAWLATTCSPGQNNPSRGRFCM